MAKLYAISPDGTTHNMTIVTYGTTESLEVNGWSKLPNGMMIQWGFATLDYWRFPIDFGECAMPLAIHITLNASPVVTVINGQVPLTVQGVQFYLQQAGAGQVGGGLYCIAVGY